MFEEMFLSQADIFKSMAHPARLQILSLLRDGERCVCEIFPAVGIEQSCTLRHLSILKKEGLLSSRKEGLNVIYRIKDPRVNLMLDLSEDVMRSFWQDKLKVKARGE